MADLDHGPDVHPDVRVSTRAQGADVDDHVQLDRAILEGLPASKTLVAVVELPCGKPMTVPTATSVPARSEAAFATSTGRTHTEATS